MEQFADNFLVFAAMCDCLGADATDGQVSRLVDHVRQNFGSADYGRAAEVSA